MTLKNKDTAGLDRRSFMKNAGLAALAGGAVAAAPNPGRARSRLSAYPGWPAASTILILHTIVSAPTVLGGILHASLPRRHI